MSNDRQVKHQVVIATTPELAFEAVTQASELREWFSDEAWTEVQPGGRYEVRRSRGYRAEGKFTEVDAPRRAAFTWNGTGEPGETAVEFTVEAVEGGVKVVAVHGGFGSGDEWDQALAASGKGWLTGLENLKSMLETGVDLRIARRSFLGIVPDLLDAERAAKEGITVERGIYIQGTLDNTAARAAGIVKGDVIVALGGLATPGSQEMTAALRAHHAGDVVDVELVRGQVRETVRLTLGEWPRPEVPGTAEGLADFVRERYGETDAELKAAIEGLSEAEARQCPSTGEWSVNEVLAHLSIVERDTQFILSSYALDGWLDSGPGNTATIPGRLAAVQATAPTLAGLLDRYLADERETVALLRGLPEETVAHKARTGRIGQAMAFLPIHTRDHIEQIKTIVKAVRVG